MNRELNLFGNNMNKEELIQHLSDKYKVDKKQVEQAIHSQFKFAKNAMEQSWHPTVRLPYFGKFVFNTKKYNKIKENVKRFKADQQSEEENKEKS